MTCLTDGELQSFVDNEATNAQRAHVTACVRCRERADARRAGIGPLLAAARDGALPPAVEMRIRAALASPERARGATVLRGGMPPARFGSAWRWAIATAAAAGLTMSVVLPRLGSPTSLSAAEILGRSLQTLSSAYGVELLEYELSIAGMLEGPHRIVHLIDHDNPDRFRFANYGPDGVLLSAISQDPFSGRRSHFLRVDGRTYIVHINGIRKPPLSLPQMAQAQIEAVIAMMQTTSDQKLTTVDTPAGRQYVIEMPAIAPKADGGILNLYHARAVIDARDFRIRQFEATGTLLKQPYSVSFTLIRQAVARSISFELERGPDDVVLEGDESRGLLLNDLASIVLRELGRVKGR